MILFLFLLRCCWWIAKGGRKEMGSAVPNLFQLLRHCATQRNKNKFTFTSIS